MLLICLKSKTQVYYLHKKFRQNAGNNFYTPESCKILKVCKRNLSRKFAPTLRVNLLNYKIERCKKISLYESLVVNITYVNSKNSYFKNYLLCRLLILSKQIIISQIDDYNLLDSFKGIFKRILRKRVVLFINILLVFLRKLGKNFFLGGQNCI